MATALPESVAIRHIGVKTRLSEVAADNEWCDQDFTRADHVMVVDDHHSIRVALRAVLEASGYRVTEADDGASALFKLCQLNPSIVVLDLTMEYLDGEEFMSVVAKMDPRERPQVVVLTARASSSSAIELAEMGARAYLAKPVSPDVLVSVVRYVGSTRRQAAGFVEFVSDCLDVNHVGHQGDAS
jgi:DNA-binding response OmpR family regulator